MTTELLQKYAHLADLVRPKTEREVDDALIERVVLDLTFDNIQYLVHKSIVRAFTSMCANPFEFEDTYDSQLDINSVDRLAVTMAEYTLEPDFIDRSFALAEDVLKINEGRVREFVFADVSDPIPRSRWRTADDIEKMRLWQERIIFLSPQAVDYLYRPGQFAHESDPSTQLPRMVKLLRAFEAMQTSYAEGIESMTYRLFALDASSVKL